MIEVYTSVPSFAQLSQGQFTIEWRPAGSHFVSQRVALDVALKSGLAQQDKIQAPYSGSANLTLRVDNGQAQTEVLVDGVEDDSELYLFGLARKFFVGLLRHPAHGGAPLIRAAPTCELRCLPQDKPKKGPGCLECEDGGLIFRVCC